MEKRIYYHDTDAGGVVYYGNYLKYLEEARTEFLENKGLKMGDVLHGQFLYAVRECHIIYRSPARYGETIICDATLKGLKAAQILFDQKIYEKSSQRLLVEANVTLVSLTPDFKPTVIPDHIRNLILS